MAADPVVRAAYLGEET
ncbi:MULTISPECIES: hypothetical protein [unclassified Streptomyces]|nr:MULTISPECIES: hypothetical protein [unclassified Streptomyces]WKX23585.1 hypothetical protein Q3Y68_33605 [Streptomyces sp. HUAS CX7]